MSSIFLSVMLPIVQSLTTTISNEVYTPLFVPVVGSICGIEDVVVTV